MQTRCSLQALLVGNDRLRINTGFKQVATFRVLTISNLHVTQIKIISSRYYLTNPNGIFEYTQCVKLNKN